jgi:hypothetical protein
VSERPLQNMGGDAQQGPTLLRVAGLDGPPVGGGCCAVSAVDLVLDELDSWPGLLTLEAAPDAGTVLVLVSDEEDLAHALDALGDRGFPASVAREDPVQ